MLIYIVMMTAYDLHTNYLIAELERLRSAARAARPTEAASIDAKITTLEARLTVWLASAVTRS